MKIIGSRNLDQLSAQARSSQRLRHNLNLHDDYAELCQRLFNALEPGTYIRPHRHTEPPKPETFVIIRGALALLVFDDAGAVVQAIRLAADGEYKAVDLPAGVWHTAVALVPGTIFFETKPGPYAPLSDKDFAPWAPAQDAPTAGSYLAQLGREFDVAANRDDVHA